jgi:two-component system, cell cycle sensor histidine kinase and response regulator CckA
MPVSPEARPHSRHILVVDDERTVVDFVEKVLEIGGHHAMTATSPEAALALCEQHGAPMLLLTDLKMPRIEGDVLAAQLRSWYPALKVLYLTGFVEQLYRKKGRLFRGEACLEKPCTIDGLLDAVSQLLSDDSSEPHS